MDCIETFVNVWKRNICIEALLVHDMRRYLGLGNHWGKNVFNCITCVIVSRVFVLSINVYDVV